jgi:preprotein translocase subunit SecY
MASNHCPNPECPFLKKFRRPAEYREGFSTCSDCGGALSSGSAPEAMAMPAAAVAATPVEVAAALPSSKALPGELPLRVAVSLLVLLITALCQRVMLPGLDPSMLADLEAVGSGTEPASMLSVFGLGLNPLLSAFVLVEVLALIIPAWRRLRTGGPAGRAHLRSYTVVLGLLFAFVQAAGLARFYESFQLNSGHPLFLEEGAPSMHLLSVLLVGSVVFLHGLTVLVDKRGLGNGYAVVLLGLALSSAIALVDQWVGAVSRGTVSLGNALIAVLGLMAVTWAITRILRGQVPAVDRGTDHPAWLPLPTSGLAPVSIAAALVSLPATLGNLGMVPMADLARMLESASGFHALVSFVLCTLLAIALSWLFHQPRRVAATWAALTGKGEAERAVVYGRVALRTRDLLPVATAWSVALTVLTWAPSWLASSALSLNVPEAGSLLLMVAVGLDLLDEVRMRREGTWVPVWPLHRSYEVEPALAALSAAGIPARARGASARALLQFFGPYLPIELMVPPTRAAEARALLEAAAIHAGTAPASR